MFSFQIQQMTYNQTFQTLYKRTKTNKVQEWKISVEQVNNHVEVVIRFGNQDGKKQEKREKILSGKNIGKVNETSIFEQACSEAESKWKKQLDSGYKTEVPEEGDCNRNALGLPMPMLAKSFEDFTKSNKIDQIVFTQPKLDGFRLLAHIGENDQITFYTRKGKKVEILDHLIPDVIRFAKEYHYKVGDILDGELYIHDKTVSFEDLASWAKRKQENTEKLEYWVYDVILTSSEEMNYSFNSRFPHIYSNPTKPSSSKVKLVPTKLIRDTILDWLHGENHLKIDLYNQFNECIDQGYEGMMVRHGSDKYDIGGRASQLLKYKQFKDEEFKIVGFKWGRLIQQVLESETKVYQPVIFKCVTSSGEEFDCNPPGTLAERSSLKAEEYIGQLLTVKFFEKTQTGVPRFPVGLRYRQEI